MELALSILSLLIALAAFFFSVWQFFTERTRRRREATIHAFDELEEAVFSNPAYKVLPAGDEALRFALTGQPEWNAATLALSRIEHFAVGINSGIYDIRTLTRWPADSFFRSTRDGSRRSKPSASGIRIISTTTNSKTCAAVWSGCGGKIPDKKARNLFKYRSRAFSMR